MNVSLGPEYGSFLHLPDTAFLHDGVGDAYRMTLDHLCKLLRGSGISEHVCRRLLGLNGPYKEMHTWKGPGYKIGTSGSF